MMKLSKTVFAMAIASTFLVTSCRDTKTKTSDDHGHEHNADGSHIEEPVEQEVFQVEKDSIKKETDAHEHDAEGNHSNSENPKTHKHDDGKEHLDH
jgi:hypothetical protein